MASPRSLAASKAAETRWRNQEAERAQYRREHYILRDSRESLGSYRTADHSLHEVLRRCGEFLSDPEYPTAGVAVWHGDVLVGAVRRGENGEIIATDLSGATPELTIISQLVEA